MSKRMNETAMVAKLETKGVKAYTLQCSGYLRLEARKGDKVVATVETVDCTLPEARAKLVAAVCK